MNILYPSKIADCVTGYIILEQNAVYPLFSGHNTVCTATAVVELGLVDNRTDGAVSFKMEAPGGVVEIEATIEKGRAVAISMTSMPSFVVLQNQTMKRKEILDLVPTKVDSIQYDICFGGMFYVIIDAVELGLEIKPGNGRLLAQLGEMIKKEAKTLTPVNHPHFNYPGPDILGMINCFKNLLI